HLPSTFIALETPNDLFARITVNAHGGPLAAAALNLLPGLFNTPRLLHDRLVEPGQEQPIIANVHAGHQLGTLLESTGILRPVAVEFIQPGDLRLQITLAVAQPAGGVLLPVAGHIGDGLHALGTGHGFSGAKSGSRLQDTGRTP